MREFRSLLEKIKMKYVIISFFLFWVVITQAAIRINEVAWSGTPTSSNDEWIELFNDGEETISVENWTLKAVDESPDITLAGEIEPNGFFLLERTDDTTVPNIEANIIYAGSLSNTGEELILSDEHENEICRTPSGNWPAGESSPERRSMMWLENEWKTFLGEANEFGIFGTPGTENIIPPPEPPETTFQSAEPISVKISELSPISIGEPEWFEVEILAINAIDLDKWKIKKGTSEILLSELTFANGGQSLSGQSVTLLENGLVGHEQLNGTDFTFTEDSQVWLSDNESTPLRFVGNPSPISLPDGGGALEILNEQNEVLSSATWGNTRNGVQDGFRWGEIWNWNPIKYWPLRSNENAPTHTRGEENRTAPVFPEQLNIRIDEISPNRINGVDFIEILITEAPENSILPPWNIKHNGTELFSSGGEFVESGDRITLFFESELVEENPSRWINRTTSNDTQTEKIWESSKKNGLNKTSGTLELNIWTGTSWEKTADFICWVKDELPEAEQVRLENHPDDWIGSCFQNASILQNESIARPEESIDTNSATDFFHHFNGSPEEINIPQNAPPVPKILVQGSRRVYDASLNLTGLDGENATTDPDGLHDLKSWKWEIEGTSCGNYSTDNWEWSNVKKGIKSCEEESSRANPGVIYFNFNEQEKFHVTLTAEDYSGANASVTVELDRDPFNVGGGGSVFDAPLKKWLAKELEKDAIQERKTLKVGTNQSISEHFFDDFLTHLDYKKIDPRFWKPNPPQPKLISGKFRDRIPEDDIFKIKKNIGLVFLY